MSTIMASDLCSYVALASCLLLAGQSLPSVYLFYFHAITDGRQVDQPQTNRLNNSPQCIYEADFHSAERKPYGYTASQLLVLDINRVCSLECRLPFRPF